MKKHTLIIGAIGIAGAVALFILVREHASNSAAAPAYTGPQPQLAEAPVPQYPAPPPLPPFNVNATPYYLTFNLPPNRNLDSPQQEKSDGCGCGDKCRDGAANTVVFTQQQLNTSAANARRAFSAGPNSGNLSVQFPPDVYPWLYQKGGAA